jgi:sulfate/thiosulfate transport system ATP-binding protein
VRATRVPPLPSDIAIPGSGGADQDRTTLTSA